MSITAPFVDGRMGKAIDTAVAPAYSLASLAALIPNNLSSGESINLDFLGAIPGFKKWQDKRQSSQFVPYAWSMKNEKFEDSIVVPDEWLINDKTGLVDMRIGQLVAKYAIWPGSLIASLINASETDKGFDGKAFFADDHVWGKSGTIDNKIAVAAAAGTTPTVEEFAQGILSAYSQITGFLDDQGEPINEAITDLKVVVGNALAGTALQAIQNTMLDTGAGTIDNPVKGLAAAGVKITLVASPRITLSSKFCMFNTSPNACPFIFSENTALRNRTIKDDRHDRDRWEHGLKAVGNAAYGMFTDAVLCEFT
jgi:phage major head subunit gpT-like protein